MDYPVTTIAEGIGSLYRQARQTHGAAVAYLLEAGVQLRRTKASLPHGEWLLWVKEHEEQLGFGEDTAQRLMRGAQQFASTALNAALTDEESARISRLIWRNDPEPSPYPAGPPIGYLKRVDLWSGRRDWAEFDELDGDQRAEALESLGRMISRFLASPGAATEPPSQGRVVAKLTAKARKAIPGKDFAGPHRSFPIENPSHARDALSRVANRSPALKAKVRAAVHSKYPSIGGKSVKKYDQHPAPEAPKHVSPPKAAVPAGGMTHAAFEGLTHGKNDHMIGRTVKPFEKTGK